MRQPFGASDFHHNKALCAIFQFLMIFRILSVLRKLSELRPGDRLHHGPVDDQASLLEEQTVPWQSRTLGRFAPPRRSLIKLTPTRLFVDWACLQPNWEDLTIEQARAHDALSFLIPLHAHDALAGQFLRQHWSRFFAQMLETVSADPECWPMDRSWASFHQWFEVEHLGLVLDLAEASPEQAATRRGKNSGIVAALTYALRRLTRWSLGRSAGQAWARSRRERALIHQQNRGIRRSCSSRASSF